MNSAFIEMRIDCKIERMRELDLQFASAQIPFQIRLPEFQSHKMRPDQIWDKWSRRQANTKRSKSKNSKVSRVYCWTSLAT
jgi:hypothetical protein